MTTALSTPRCALCVALATIAGWLTGFLALCVLALMLSAVTRRVFRRLAPPPPNDERRYVVLFRAHSILLFVCCVYYYLSVWLVLGVALTAAAGFVYAGIRLAKHPFGIILFIGGAIGLFTALRGVAAVVTGLFAGLGGEPPGRKLRLADHPRLDALLDEVAARVGTRPMDAVYLIAGVDVGISQKGPIVARMRGAGERCLVLGLGLVEGLSVRSLRVVLAHEYGHFLNHSFVLDGLAVLVESALRRTLLRLRLARTGRWWNPAWLFAICFRWLFQLVERGGARISELLADLVAAGAYGGESVSLALRDTITADVRFDEHARSLVRDYLRSHRPLVNLYRAYSETPVDEKRVEEHIRERLARGGRSNDEHPCTLDRLIFATAVQADSPSLKGDGEPASVLIADRERCELEVTTDFQSQLDARYGINSPADVGPADASSK
jgi:Zn-dependent protease with chaperone function